jgi:hypothetical protein
VPEKEKEGAALDKNPMLPVKQASANVFKYIDIIVV